MKIIRTSTVALSLDVLLKGQLSFLAKYYEVIAVSGQDANLRKVEIREGVKTYSVPMERPIRLLKDFKSLYDLFLYFKKEKPAIVHSITPKAGLLSMLAAKMVGVPIRIHTFTGLIFPNRTGLFQKILINMDRLLCWAATDIYPEGLGVKKDLISYKITKKSLRVLANGNINGIDIDYFSPSVFNLAYCDKVKNSTMINAGDFVFIFVGRLVADKGINELVSAFKQIHSSFSEAKLLLVGPLETELDPLNAATLKEIEANKSIISVGYQNDVRPYFAIANALVFPSYREGFPNVVLQAGAMGLPSIVTDINGCNEIVENELNGLIIPVKNTEAIGKAMEQLLLDKLLYNKLQSQARKKIVDNYEQSVVWNAILAEYKRLENNV